MTDNKNHQVIGPTGKKRLQLKRPKPWFFCVIFMVFVLYFLTYCLMARSGTILPDRPQQGQETAFDLHQQKPFNLKNLFRRDVVTEHAASDTRAGCRDSLLAKFYIPMGYVQFNFEKWGIWPSFFAPLGRYVPSKK